MTVSLFFVAKEWALYLRMRLSTGDTMIRPLREMTTLKEEGNALRLLITSLSHSSDRSAVRTATVFPFLSCTG